jgi:hypothetical protein
MIYRFPAVRAITTITRILMIPGRETGAFVGTGCGGPEGVGTGLAGTVAGVVTVAVVTVAGVVGTFSTILKVVDPTTSTVMPDTFRIYSSGLNAAVSTSKDQRLYPVVPGTTCTIPETPEN